MRISRSSYRVLFFIHVIENQLCDQIKMLLEADPELEIVIAPRDGIDKEQWKKADLESFRHRLQVWNLPSNSYQNLEEYAKFILSKCYQHHVQLIDTHMAQSLESRATYLAAKNSSQGLRNKIRHFFWISSGQSFRYIVSLYGRERDYLKPGKMKLDDRQWIQKVVKSASLLICHDKTLVQTVKAIVGDTVSSYLLYNAVDIDRAQKSFDQTFLRQKYGLATGQKIVLYNHRTMPEKRPLVYVDALASIKQCYPDVCFLFIGPRRLDTELGAEIQKRINESGLNSNVVWIDRRISGYEMDEVYSISHVAVNLAVLIVPSLSTLEAMSFGIPLVIADELDSELYVRDGENGFIVPPEPAAVADAVARILQDDELRRRMGKVGRARAARYFDIRDWGKRVTQCYRHVLFGEPIPPPQRFE